MIPHGMTRRELRERAAALHKSTEPRILMVCTGNICRSPMAEALLRARMGTPEKATHAVRVHSAGTRALIDKAMTADAQQLAVRNGAEESDVEAHRARWLVEQVAEDADLIFAMAREHRTTAVELAPRMLRKTFTIREFARLASALTDDEVKSTADTAGTEPRARLAAVTALVTQQRGMSPHAADDDDVIDPYRRSHETYERSAAQLVPAVDEVARILRATLA
ncbi:arsenate reductase/protein-tyrosine-phosphatase family protein [Microbacterium sp. A196]|uniref:arsenate reductase/protein-tyrosine-phosphatase family protein n=1 Tax=Microbacterium sp. A196 TaxID=3457320 RepID=UPI003FCF3DF2